MILVLDNRDSFVHNLARYLRLAGASTEVIRSNEISVENALALNPSGIVLSPGPGRPEDAGICVELIKSAPQIPILGVCLGHQCLANAYGGKTLRSGQPTHGRASLCVHDDDPMFDEVASPFKAGRYHSLMVEVPSSLKVTAKTDLGEIMAMRHVAYPHFGLQFHPESLLTPDGLQMIATFVKTCQAYASPLLD